MSQSNGRQILVVGLTCVDVVLVCDSFPVEDSQQRCKEKYWQRGGNASNTSTVLAHSGEKVELLATFSNTSELKFLQNDLKNNNINISHCIVVDNSISPQSMCIINSTTGSRTIIHNQPNLREVNQEDFSKLDLFCYKWIHFEGRYDVNEVRKMLGCVDAFNRTSDYYIPTSVELEKSRTCLGNLSDKADYVFVGKDYAKLCGCRNMVETVLFMYGRIRVGATVICAWGEDGAAAVTPDGCLSISPSFPPETVRDTLGAGDTFIASTIYALSRGKSVAEAIIFGCRGAGAKCGMKGYTGMRDWFKIYYI